jgi:signal peptidase I
VDEHAEVDFRLWRVLLVVGAILLPFVLAGGAAHALGYRLETTVGDSMNPTLMSGGHWIGRELGADEALTRGEIVSFEPTADQTLLCGKDHPVGVRYVKRVIGLPGDRLADDRHRLLIDGWLLDERYLETPADGARSFAPVQVPEGAYFLLGDDRAGSCDSRTFGPVARAQIRDRLVVRLPA